ncbi:hypothetical protein evm_002607 [Chilo suppressalis]|nr:hypothetical protein evm_002607 [Chilo suppressalis]
MEPFPVSCPDKISSTTSSKAVAVLCPARNPDCFLGAPHQFRCDYTYVPNVEGWLKYHEIPSNWNDARLRCHMEGAYLASPLNKNLQDAMTTMMNYSKTNCAVFTGIHATFSKGDYASIEGVPLSKIPHTWANDEPDNYQDNENCLILFPDGNMADAKCSETFRYFCYKKKTPTVITNCGTIDPEYTFDARTGKCYKFHRLARTWSRAYMNCMAEGAHLAIINSDIEAKVLKEIFEKNPAGSIIGGEYESNAYIGFNAWTERSDFRTIEGQILKEAGYEKYYTGEPTNLDPGEFCGTIYRAGLIGELWCDKRIAFICEKDPSSLSCDDY